MITSEEAINFLRYNSAITKSTFEQEAGLTKGTLTKVMSRKGDRTLKPDHLKKLFPVMVKYGYKPSEGATAKVFAIVNHKGGVGKTTTTLNLGKALAILGQRVLVVDLDPQGSLTQIAGLENVKLQVYHAFRDESPLPVYPVSERLDCSPSDITLATIEQELIVKVGGEARLKKSLHPLKANYDYILLDCPPALNVFTNSALVAAHGCIITIQPEASAIKGVNNLFDRIYEIQEYVNHELRIRGILVTLLNARTNIHQDSVRYLHQTLASFTLFETKIHQNVTIQESQMAQQDIFTYDSKSTGAKDYMSLAREILKT